MNKKNDSIEKLDEQIRKLENKDKEKVEEKKTTTKVFKNIEDTGTKLFGGENDLVTDVLEEKKEESELLEELIETKKNEVYGDCFEIAKEENNNQNKKISKKKNVFLISIILGILLVVGIIVICVFIFNKDDEKKDVETVKKLTESEKEELIKNYGEALEGVINIYYSKQGVLLEYADAVRLIEFDEDISCDTHEFYKNGKVYLAQCSINGIKTKYTYGDEKVEFESSDEILNVYVEKASKKVSLEIPKGSTYDTYTVHCGGKYSDPEIQGDYVIYYDSEYVLHMKNYKTDENVLKDISYQAIWPIRAKDNVYDSTYILVKISNFWGVYNYVTNEQVISPMYTSFLPYLGGGVGDTKAIETIDNNKIVAWDGKSYGVIDYTTNRTIIPFEYISMTINGDYLWVIDNESKGHIYDTEGNIYLENTYDKIYGIVSGDNALIQDGESTKLISVSGEVKYDYGKIENIGDYNFGIYYNNQAIFQFYGDTSMDNCIEVVYDITTKEGSLKSVTCGGIAKPILYLYPEEKTVVKVTFEHPEYLETTYPKFTNKWLVTADSDGNLTDKDGKNYYALYWDEKKVHTVSFNEGFYVEKDNAINFLEEKLSYIGLSEREMNEFIMYWLPILEKNGKSLVYFELTEERESYNKINISPKPDSLLRVVIHIKKVDKKTDIKKQSLVKFKRKGFVAVEWGGTTY